MEIASCTMWRDHPSHRCNRLRCPALPEKQQHGATAHIEGAITLIGVHARKTEKRFIETRAPLDVFCVNAGFENADHLRHQDPREISFFSLRRIALNFQRKDSTIPRWVSSTPNERHCHKQV